MRPLSLFLAWMVFFNTSCIHTQSREIQSLKVSSRGETIMNALLQDDLIVESIVYRESILPLEEFFLSLKKGSIKDPSKR